MILTRKFLREKSKHFLFESVGDYKVQVLNENNQLFSKKQAFDVFLSHSFLDQDEVLCLVQLFNKCGYSVYVDWLYDQQLDRLFVTKDTAEKLKQRMNQSKGLAYLATSNATSSKWCPWELGYFDGKSGNSRCCILPVLMYDMSEYNGQEYLGLYPYLKYEKYANTSNYEFWVHEQGNEKYIPLRYWLDGKNPIEH